MANKKIEHNGVTIEVVSITPKMANEMLDKNVNRTLREGRVEEMVLDMKNGDWQFNGDTVVLDTNDDLRDGQHRLTSIVRSGETVETIIVKGVQPIAQQTMDLGSRRTVADTLHLAGEQYTSMLAAIMTLVHSWEANGYPVRSNRSRLQPNGALDMLENHPGLREIAAMMQGDGVSVSSAPSSLGASLYIIKKGAEDAEENVKQLYTKFENGVIKGIGIEDQMDPRLQLRTRFMKIREDKLRDTYTQAAVSYLTMKAWLLFIDQSFKTLRIPPNESFSLFKPKSWPDMPGDSSRFRLADADYVKRVMNET